MGRPDGSKLQYRLGPMMQKHQKLVLVKACHTVAWAFLATCCCYILLTGIVGGPTRLTWVATGCVVVETLVLACNRGQCPLTPLARRYTDEERPNFDIYLPEVIARYNKVIFGTIFGIGLVLNGLRLLL